MMGQGISMGGQNVMADTQPEPDTPQVVDAIEQSIRYVVGQMPSHGDYLARYCPAQPA
jgi:tryptophan halogenase